MSSQYDVDAVFNDRNFQEKIMTNNDPKIRQLYETELRNKTNQRKTYEREELRRSKKRMEEYCEEKIRKEKSCMRIVSCIWILYLIVAFSNIMSYSDSYFSNFETMKLLVSDSFFIGIPFLLLTLLVIYSMGD